MCPEAKKKEATEWEACTAAQAAHGNGGQPRSLDFSGQRGSINVLQTRAYSNEALKTRTILHIAYSLKDSITQVAFLVFVECQN